MSDELSVAETKSKFASDNELSNAAGCSNKKKCSLDILKLNIKQDCTISLTNECDINFEKDVKRKCKVLKLPIDLDIDNNLKTIQKLSNEEFSNLFVFIIDIENFKLFDQNAKENSQNFKNVEQTLINFDEERPIVLQLTSKNEDITKFYYKDEGTEKLLNIDQQFNDFKSHKNFPTLFMAIMMHNDFEKFEHNDFIEAENSCIILKFLRLFNVSVNFLDEVILSCGEFGTLDQLLAALDAPFGKNKKFLSYEAEDYLSLSFTYANNVTHSILIGAIQNFKAEIVDFLIENFTHLIQNHIHKHKVEISTAALDTDQIDILCDLIQYADFPFPKDFDSESIEDERLCQIVDERSKFHEAINCQDKNPIEKFIESNPNSKFVFNTENQSALRHAFHSKAFEIFFELKSLGFRASSVENINYKILLEGDELNDAERVAARQMHKNVLGAKKFNQRSVIIMLAKSTISNRKLDKETEANHFRQIEKWFDDIYKTRFGSELIDAAAQCDHLKFIFDFECETVSNIRLEGRAAASALTNFKWIMIGAKISNNNSEQQIKGSIAHKLGHYVIQMVFENKQKPYHVNDTVRYITFDEIVKEIDQWTNRNGSNKIDDECDGIISTVFTLYGENDHHLELIVRVPQIYAKFDDNKDKLNLLTIKYDKLFNYYEFVVVPEMRMLNLKNRKFNKLCELLPEIENSKLELASNSLDLLLDNNTTPAVVISNVPRLLFVKIYKASCAVAQKLFIDDKNLFLTSKSLDNIGIVDEFESIQRELNNINIYVDSTKEIGSNMEVIFNNKSHKIFIVVQSKNHCQELRRQLDQIKQENYETEINFNWNDLTLQCRRKLMYFDFDFQQDKTCFYRLMANDDCKDVKMLATEFEEVIDNQLFNFLVEESKFSVNQQVSDELSNDSANNSTEATTTYLQDDLIENKKTQKYIVISDIAGSGKSWAMKGVMKYLIDYFTICWVTYVDLKQFIGAFKSMTNDADFLSFMLSHVLKHHQTFELKIFKKLYEKGKVFVLFDGFDEISPNYCHIVVNIIRSFESNGGNQMWIATRDFYEVDLQQHLDLDVVYKLDEFMEEDGVDIITSIWTLNEIGIDSIDSSDPENFKMSSNYKLHQKHAQKLMKKLSILQLRSIGFPQFFKMAAEVFKNGKDLDHDLNLFNIYKEFVLIRIKGWLHEKGEARENDSIVALSENTSFLEIHQILAIKSLFPNDEELSDIEYDEDIWSADVIIGCGLVTKNGNNFSFFHETFREFFAADFIFDQMKKGKLEKFIKVFIKLLTIEKHNVIRMFINDVLNDELITKIRQKEQMLSKEFDKNINGRENISFVYRENLKNLSNLLIDLLKNSHYEKFKEILEINSRRIFRAIPKNATAFAEFCEFLVDYLEAEDLKEFVRKNQFLQDLTKSTAKADVILKIEHSIEQKVCCVRDVLSSNSDGEQNFFMFLFLDVNDLEKLKILFETLSTKYFSMLEMCELLEHNDDDRWNYFHYCVHKKNGKKFKFIWEKVEEIFASQNLTKKFKELLKQKVWNEWNILDYTAYCTDIKFHEILWKLLLKTFENRDELKDYILHKNKKGYNFVQYLVEHSSTEIIKFTIKKLEENFSIEKFQEILMSKCSFGMNFVLRSVLSKNIEILQFCWGIVQNFFKSDEQFLEYLKKVDIKRFNIFHYAAWSSSREILDFVTREFEKMASEETIKKLLNALDIFDRNLLLLAEDYNTSLEAHQFLWELIDKYFNHSEIYEMIYHRGGNGQTTLMASFESMKKEVVELTWSKIQNVIEEAEHVKYLTMKDFKGQNLFKYIKKNKNEGVHEWFKNLMKKYNLKMS